jgi:hypothetical protein
MTANSLFARTRGVTAWRVRVAALPRPSDLSRAIIAAIAWIAALVSFAVGVRAAPLQRDLGEGLLYFRIHALPADLPSDEAIQKHAAVIDLRYVKTDATGASVLGSWLKFHATPQSPLFVLVNGATSAPLAAMLAERTNVAGLLTIGTRAPRTEPDITVTTSAEIERRAYDALEAGTSVAALTTDNPDKQRNDEASLAHDRAPAPTAESDTLLDDEKTPAAKPRPLIDSALQRALQVYRGLKAMKALPAPSSRH